MKELYVIKIIYMHHMKFSASIEHCDVLVFSSESKAEEFLVGNDFVYGSSAYFTEVGWYHKKSLNLSSFELPRLIYAEIEHMQVDDENESKSYCERCTEFLFKE